MDRFCRAIARSKGKSETNSLKESDCSYLSSLRCETLFKILGHWRKTTELEFWTFWAVASKRSIGWENGGQIRIQREILHRYGEFERNRREKIFSDVPPRAKLPIFLLVIVESRAIARLKAKSETNSVKEAACSSLSTFRCETPFKIWEIGEKRQS